MSSSPSGTRPASLVETRAAWAEECSQPQMTSQRSPGRSQEGHGSKVKINPVKLPEFAWKPGENLQTFLNQMDNWAPFGSWSPDYHLGMLYAQLRARALHYAETIAEADRENQG